MEKQTKQFNALEQIQTKENLKKIVREVAAQEIEEQLKSGLFTSRKLTDTPSDALQVVNRKYVNLNGATGSRPVSSILGQFYFDTSLGYPIWWSGTTWVKSDGTPA